MNIISSEVSKKYARDKYPMSTGSDEWQNLKTDFAVEDDAIAGTIMQTDYGDINLNKINTLKSNLEKFKVKLDIYNSKEEIETKEKEIIIEKIGIGLEIYNIIIDSLKKHEDPL